MLSELDIYIKCFTLKGAFQFPAFIPFFMLSPNIKGHLNVYIILTNVAVKLMFQVFIPVSQIM